MDGRTHRLLACQAALRAAVCTPPRPPSLRSMADPDGAPSVQPNTNCSAPSPAEPLSHCAALMSRRLFQQNCLEACCRRRRLRCIGRPTRWPRFRPLRARHRSSGACSRAGRRPRPAADLHHPLRSSGLGLLATAAPLLCWHQTAGTRPPGCTRSTPAPLRIGRTATRGSSRTSGAARAPAGGGSGSFRHNPCSRDRQHSRTWRAISPAGSQGVCA